MIRTVTFEKTEFADIPNRFEAGTPPIAEAIGLAAAIDYVTALGFDRIAAHEQAVLAYATERLSDIPGLRIVGTARTEGEHRVLRAGECAHPHDIGTVLDRERRRRARRPSLRPAADGPLRHGRHGARLVRAL